MYLESSSQQHPGPGWLFRRSFVRSCNVPRKSRAPEQSSSRQRGDNHQAGSQEKQAGEVKLKLKLFLIKLIVEFIRRAREEKAEGGRAETGDQGQG